MTALVASIDAHRGAFEYDWRTRFHQPVSDVGGSMSWGEAVRLFKVIAADRSSQVGAALAGWQYPATRTDLALMDVFDLLHIVHAKRKPPPLPRPWDPAPKRFGVGTRIEAESFRDTWNRLQQEATESTTAGGEHG